MESSFSSELAAFVDRAYRKLVTDCAKDKPPKVEEAIGILASTQRTPTQLDGDVQRLRTRQADAALRNVLSQLDRDVDQLTQEYGAATAAKSAASTAIGTAKAAKGQDATESAKLVNAAQHAYADARADAEAAWNRLRATRERRDAMRDEVEGRLKATAAGSGDWSDPANYALV